MAQVGPQVGLSTGAPVASPLGLTSPLGLGPGQQVAPTGIPMGAAELATPGISPPPDMSSLTGETMPLCNTGVGAAGVDMTGTAAFDGGGLRSTACPPAAAGTMANSSASASSAAFAGLSSSVGRVGIPLGSVELGGGGLSPPPDATVVISPPMAPAAPPAFVSPAATAAVGTPAAAASSAILCPTMSAPTSGGATTPGGC
ncbi:MAG: hypothetical protein ACOY4R_05470 [Pseudomonadota bacterium]